MTASYAEHGCGKYPDSGATLLVVDDDEGLRALACAVLRQAGYRLLEADSGGRAMELLEENASRIRLLITDIVMPDMSGPELAQWARWSRRELEVLYISGYNERVPLAARWSSAFLLKPFANQALVAKVRQILDKPRRNPTILVADDDVSVRGLFREVLAARGYRVLEAGDGRQAMNMLALEPVDLLITDLVMPDQEGLETIRRLRQAGVDLRIIAVSGAVNDYLQVARLLGANSVVAKPLSPDALLEAVQRVLAGEAEVTH